MDEAVKSARSIYPTPPEQSWTQLRLPFIVWDAVTDFAPAGGGGSVEGEYIDFIQQAHRGQQGELLLIANGRLNEMSNMVRLVASNCGSKDDVPLLDDVRWQSVTVRFIDQDVPCQSLTTSNGLMITIAHYCGGAVVIGHRGCEVPPLIPAKIGTLYDLFSSNEDIIRDFGYTD